MSTPVLTILDYGAGNVRSVQKAFEHLGYSASITTTPQEVLDATAVVFPGQGASAPALAGLHRRGLVGPLLEVLNRGTPFFGVCVGLQVLLESSEEGDSQCLGVLKGRVCRLPTGLKVPHMGWNQVRLRGEHPVFKGMPQDSYFYFAHSYYPVPEDESVVLGTTEYGVEFCSVAARGNLIATQFHPEKSGSVGLRLYDNFVRYLVHG